MPFKFNPFTGTLDIVPASTAETDPVFLASAAFGIDAADIANWDSKQAALTFPLAASLGGTGIANGASASLTLPNVALTIAGGVTGGVYTLPATAGGGTFPLLATANVFTVGQFIDGTADEVQLKLQAHSTNTNPVFVIEDSTTADVLAIYNRGQIGVGQSATLSLTSDALFAFINSNVDLSGAMTVSNGLAGAFTNTLSFLNGDMRIAGTSAFQNVRGLNFIVNSRNTSTGNVLTGVYGSARINLSTGRASKLTGGDFSALTDNATGGTVPTLRALVLQAAVQHASVTATTAWGIDIAAFINSGTAATIYGVQIGNQAVGTYTDAFALQAGTGRVSLLGSIGKASAAGAVWDGIELRAATATITGSTNITTATGFNYHSIAQPTLSAASALTVTNAATLYIANAPAGAGAGPVTITNAYAFWVDAGMTRLDGDIDHNGTNVGLYSAAPVAQATVAGAAAAFVANTSAIVDDTATFDGYTIGQVVKALRNIGVLA